MKFNFVFALFFVFSGFFASQNAQAYPNFISHGYGSCMSCHYNPFGNGPLTDYGRAVGATAIANRVGWPKKMKDDEIGEKSGFLFGEFPVSWLRPSIDYRGLYLDRSMGKAANEDEIIHMDLNGTLVAKFMDRDKLIVVGQIAYSPLPRGVPEELKLDEYRSREHYVGYRFSKEIGLYAGLMDKVFGLRVPDHIAFSRTITGLGQNDQTHGILMHYMAQTFEVGVQPFMGNFVQDSKLRQKGLTTMGEYAVSEKIRVGGSLLFSTSEYLSQNMFSAHTRMGLGLGNSIMAEAGQVNRTVEATSAETSSRYLFTQTHFEMTRGLFALLTYEILQANVDSDAKTYRIGPGLQIFPTQRVEWRADLYHTINSPESGPSNRSFDMAVQLHLWL